MAIQMEEAQQLQAQRVAEYYATNPGPHQVGRVVCQWLVEWDRPLETVEDPEAVGYQEWVGKYAAMFRENGPWGRNTKAQPRQKTTDEALDELREIEEEMLRQRRHNKGRRYDLRELAREVMEEQRKQERERGRQ